MDSKAKAVRIAGLALDKKAGDVVVLELKGLAEFADYFVICSGQSSTQVKAIVENITEGLIAGTGERIKPIGVEGRDNRRWVLIDYSDVVVHVFDEETRRYYELEKLWLDAPRIQINEGQSAVGGKDKRAVRP